jgi:hypothetical protein
MKCQAREYLDKAYDDFVDIVLRVYNACFPLKCKKFNRYKDKGSPWITPDIIKLIQKRDILAMKKNKCKSVSRKQQLTEEFKGLRAIICRDIRAAKRNYYERKFQETANDMKATWANLKQFTSQTKKSPLCIFSQNGSSDTANNFNRFFAGIGSSYASQIEPSVVGFENFLNSMVSPTQSLFLNPTHETELIKIVRAMKTKTSSGHDNLTPKLVKSVIEPLLTPLCHIMNASLLFGVVPSAMKRAKVTPIHKSGEYDVYNNYRPVSVLVTFSKILERLVYNRVYSFLSKLNILNPHQYGFRKGYSTEAAIIELQDRVLNSISSHEWCAGVFMDLSKAFDTLDHQILLRKLHYYGIRGLAHEWFANYLSNRTQYVYIRELDETSSDLGITCGVPQGSILGPLLFLIYINDLFKSSTSAEIILFADDTNLLFRDKDLQMLERKCNLEVANVASYLAANKLSLNAKKTKLILFHTSQRPNKNDIVINLKINDIPIERVASTKFLGVIIDQHFSWRSHIQETCIKVGRMIAVISRFKNFFPKNILKMMYSAFVMPYLQYGILAWGSVNTSRLFLLQKRAVRIIENTQYKAHSDPLFKNLRILKLNDVFRHKLVQLYTKINKNKCTPYIQGLWANFLQSNIRNRPLRSDTNILINLPKVVLTLEKQKIVYQIATAYNFLINLPTNINIINSQSHVKSILISLYESQCMDINCYVCR